MERLLRSKFTHNITTVVSFEHPLESLIYGIVTICKLSLDLPILIR